MKRNNLYKGLYNPNRFNALDSAVVFSVLLAVFAITPYVNSFLFKDFFKAVYQFDTYAYLLINILISQTSILVVAFIWCKIRKVNPFDGGGYTAKFDGIQILMSVILIMGIMLTFYKVHKFVSDDADFLYGPLDLDINTSILTPFLTVLYLFLSAALPAVIEEMAFRGIIMRGLEQFGALTAVLLSSVAFSLMHGSFNQLVLQFLGGFAIGGVVLITKNYILGSIMHAFNNLFAVIYALIVSDEFAEELLDFAMLKVVDIATVVIGIICIFVSAIYFLKLVIHNFNVDKYKNSGDLLTKKRYVETDEQTGEIRFLPPSTMVEMKNHGEKDDRLYAISGRLRPINKKAPAALSLTLFSIAIVFAIIIIIFQI